MKTKLFLLIFIVFLCSSLVSAQDSVNHSMEGHEEIVDVVYFYGVGCPHCEDLEEFLDEIKDDYNLNIVSYEVYLNDTNRELAQNLAEAYDESFRGVPMTFIGDSAFMGFSSSIGEEIESKIQECEEDCCDSPLVISGVCEQKESAKEKLTILGIIILALADMVNPCALAVLAMVLIALFTHDPTKKHRVLFGGLAFTLAVFITYMIYGGIIIQFFIFIKGYFAMIAPYVAIVFGVIAVLLGLANIKDALKYTPGSIGTEMPVFMRPIAKNVIKTITRPLGAFIIGIFVTLFLLPCTIGPYVVAGERLSELAFIQTLPWLVLYNIIFVLPMILITLLVYFGYTKVQDVSGWKEKHIKTIHLVSGIILVILGFLIAFRIL